MNLLILTSSIEQTTSHQYSLVEAIIWYSLFVISIITLVLYFKIKNNSKKDVMKIETKLNHITSMAKDIAEKEYNYIECKKTLTKIALTLSTFNTAFNRYKEKTLLVNFDELLTLNEKISKHIIYINTEKLERAQAIEELDKLYAEILKLKGKFEITTTLLK